MNFTCEDIFENTFSLRGEERSKWVEFLSGYGAEEVWKAAQAGFNKYGNSDRLDFAKKLFPDYEPPSAVSFLKSPGAILRKVLDEAGMDIMPDDFTAAWNAVTGLETRIRELEEAGENVLHYILQCRSDDDCALCKLRRIIEKKES